MYLPSLKFPTNSQFFLFLWNTAFIISFIYLYSLNKQTHCVM